MFHCLAVDLFGGEDEDEDDLFGAPKKKSTPPPTAPKSAPMESPKEEVSFELQLNLRWLFCLFFNFKFNLF